MRYKKIMMLAILLVGILAVSAASAAENATDDIACSEIQDNEVISEIENNDDVLKENPKTFADLNMTINGNNDSDVYLDSNYTFDLGSDSGFMDGVVVGRAVTVHGNGFTVSGEDTARIFTVSGSGVVFCDIVFVNGKTIGGGAVNGRSDFINCIFMDNYAEGYGGAVYRAGSVVNCTFVGNHAGTNGGAILEGGSVVNCTFVNNSANYGGAIRGGSVVNCTFVGNSAELGGAVCNGGSVVNCTFVGNSAELGGAMCVCSAVNCTFINNTAKDGGAINDGDALNCTFKNNHADRYGGAMAGDGSTAENCIFIGNGAINGGATYQVFVNNCTLTDNMATGCGGAMYRDVSINSTFRRNHADKDGGAVYDVSVSNCLFEYNSAENGGAMSKGKANNCIFNFNNATSCGGAAYNAKVSTNSQFNSNNAHEGSETYNVTLFEKGNAKTFTDLNIAINGNNESDVYLEDNYTFDIDHDLDFIEGILINRHLTVHGNGFTIDGDESVCIFYIHYTASCAFQDTVFVNGKNVGSGGAIDGDASCVNCTFINNVATNGGAIDGDASCVNCTFINNTAYYYGGAIYGDASCVNCTFIGNSAIEGDSGAINCGFALNCTFIDNSAGDSGGAVSEAHCVNCIFIDNTACDSGGAMMDYGAENCIFIGNSAKYGGAIAGWSSCSAVNCTFRNNHAEYGGAMSSGSAVNCTFQNNHAIYGGAAYQSDIINSSVTNNSAAECGGAMHSGFSINSTFTNNNAVKDGGATYGVVAANCLFEYNSAENGGSVNGGRATDCTFNHNNANSYGGAVCNAKVSTSCQFNSNNAPSGSNTYNVTWFERGKTKSFTDLKEIIEFNSEIYLNDNYTFDIISDYELIGGISLDIDTVIHGNGFTIDGDGVTRIFDLYSSEAVLENIVFVNGRTTGDGGAIAGWSESYAVNCTFINNIAKEGGAINGITAVNCTFINNTAFRYDGGASTGHAVNCTFINNTANREGGAIDGGNAVNCTFINNHAANAGAIYYASAENCIFIGNSADGNGGAIYADISYHSAVNCTFINNTAAGYGGALCDCDFSDCTFKGNRAGIAGNDVYPVKMSVISLTVSNFTSTYNSGDRLIINLTGDGIPIADANVTIRVYKGNALVGTYYCLSGDGWVVDLDVGSYVATVSVENQAYEVNPVNATLNIEKAQTMVISQDVTAVYNDGSKLVATLINAANGNAIGGAKIKIVIPGKLTKYITTDANGQVSLDVSKLDIGNYLSTITFVATESYNKASTVVEINVINKLDTVLTADDVTAVYKVSGNLVATLSDADGNAIGGAKLKIVIPGKITKYITTDANGQVSLNVANLDIGTYTATITFVATELYNKATTTAKVAVVDKIDTVLTAADVTAVYKVSGNLIATLKDVNGNVISGAKLKIVIPGKITKYIRTDANGQISLNVANLDIGNYTATITFVATDMYNKAVTTAKVTVANKMDTVLTAADVTALYKDGSKLVVTLKDANGNAISGAKIKIVINKVSKYITTDANGQVALSLSNLELGNYTATITFLGDEVYNKATTTAKISIVNKLDTVLTAPDVTANYKDGSKLVATLNDVNGNVISGAKIKIVLNKVTKYITTDVNGQVALSLSNLNVGSYTAAITFVFTDLYNKSTANAKVTIV